MGVMRRQQHKEYIHGSRYELLRWGENGVCQYLCTVHDTKFKTGYRNVLRAAKHSTTVQACPGCFAEKNTNQMRSSADIDKRVSDSGLPYKRVGDYCGVLTKIQYVCTLHNTNFLASPNQFVQARGTGLYATTCPDCKRDAGKPVQLTPEGYQSRLDGLPTKYLAVGLYKNNYTPITHRCTLHDLEFTAHPSNVMQGTKPCPKCRFSLTLQTAFTSKLVSVDGVDFRVQGYEERALRWIISNRDVLATEILSGYDGRDTPPIIEYLWRGKMRKYFPDFYIPKLNLVVEVKSSYTLLGEPSYLISNKRKAKACKRAGYRYALMVMDARGDRIPLPKDWVTLSRKKLESIMQTFFLARKVRPSPVIEKAIKESRSEE